MTPSRSSRLSETSASHHPPNQPTSATCALSKQHCSRARGDVLLLADQDDEWVPDGVRLLVAAATTAGVAASNLELLGTGDPLRSPLTGRPLASARVDTRHRRAQRIADPRRCRPVFRLCDGGAARDARRRHAVSGVPDGIPRPVDRDRRERNRRMSHVEAATVRRRIHDSNASTARPRGVRSVIRSRGMLVRAWVEARRRRALLEAQASWISPGGPTGSGRSWFPADAPEAWPGARWHPAEPRQGERDHDRDEDVDRHAQEAAPPRMHQSCCTGHA